MRLILVGLLVLPVLADEADDYFDLGVEYLHKGFFGRARAAFSESLVKAPDEPVTIAFLGVACVAEGRHPGLGGVLLRTAHDRLEPGRALRLDLRRLLPNGKCLELLVEEYRRRLAKATARDRLRHDVLCVLAFLEVHDGSPESAPALKLLLAESSRSRYAAALAELGKPANRGAAPRS